MKATLLRLSQTPWHPWRALRGAFQLDWKKPKKWSPKFSALEQAKPYWMMSGGVEGTNARGGLVNVFCCPHPYLPGHTRAPMYESSWHLKPARTYQEIKVSGEEETAGSDQFPQPFDKSYMLQSPLPRPFCLGEEGQGRWLQGQVAGAQNLAPSHPGRVTVDMSRRKDITAAQNS